MAGDGSALVLVLPDDTVETIVARVRQTGAQNVQLLVPDGTTTLQARDGFAQLRDTLSRPINLQVITSDEQTLDAANETSIETVRVQGARVAPQVASAAPAIPAVVPVAPRPAARPTQPLPPDDEFVDTLDQMPTTDPYGDVYDDGPMVFDEFEDAADHIRPAPTMREQRTNYDTVPVAWPADLDDEDFGTAPRRYGSRDLDDEDDPYERPRSERRTAVMSAPRAVGTTPAGRTGRIDRRYEEDPYAAEAYPTRRRSSAVPLVLLVLLLALGAAAFWYFTARATVLIQAPTSQVTREFVGEVLPISADAPSANAVQIQALPISASAVYTVTANASQQPTPVEFARGTVTLYNTLTQPFDLPAGTEFVATNEAGQEVRFLLDSPATVPASSSGLAGIQFGQVGDLQVTARSPGSASNVAENAITQIVIPNQAPIQNGGSINIQNSAMAGGSEDNVFVVTQEDVQRELSGVLTGLYYAGIDQLRSQTQNGSSIDDSTVNPSVQALGDPASYEAPVITPPIGTTLDANTPTFTIAVRANFNALAAPSNNSLTTQFQKILPTYLDQRPTSLCPDTLRQTGSSLTKANWDGTRLTIDGTIACGASPAEVRSRVLSAVRGQTHEAAEANLGALQQQGIISSYTLNSANGFSRFDQLTNIEFVGSATPAQAQPTSDTAPANDAAPTQETTP